MNIQELSELLLTYLYDRAEAEIQSFYFFSLNEFSVSFGITDRQQILDAANILETRGFVMLSLDLVGQVSALINLDGSSFVENGGETGIIAQYRNNPQAYIKVVEDEGMVYPSPITIRQFGPDMMEARSPDPVPQETAEAVVTTTKQLVFNIIDVILEDQTLDEVSRSDLLRDAETLNIQLEKTSRNKVIIYALLQELSSISSISHLVSQLSTYI
ncbi:MAG: hypothetical protein C0392_12390 [Syntrophus sp. (in: bacteria)]|nr:hypothetical protein [Syntrophus sp. (in: bacteria)]